MPPVAAKGQVGGAGGPPWQGQGVGTHLEAATWARPLLLVLLVTASCAVCTCTPTVCPQLMYVAGNTYYPYVVGLYILQSEPHQGRPYYSHACHQAYIYYHTQHAVWWVGPELGAPSGYALLEAETLTSGDGAGGAKWRYWSQSERNWFYDTGVKLVCLNISCQRFAMSSQHLPAFVSEEFHLGDVIHYDRPVYVNSASGYFLYHSRSSHDCHIWQVGAHVGDEQGFMYINSAVRNPIDAGFNWTLRRSEGTEEGSAEAEEESLNITITCLEYYQYYNNNSLQVNMSDGSTNITIGRDVIDGTTSQTVTTSQIEGSSPTYVTDSGSLYKDSSILSTTSREIERTASDVMLASTTTSTTTNMEPDSDQGVYGEVSTVPGTRSDPEVVTTTASSEETSSPSTIAARGVSKPDSLDTPTTGEDAILPSPTGSNVDDALITHSGEVTTDLPLFNRDLTTVGKSADEQQNSALSQTATTTSGATDIEEYDTSIAPGYPDTETSPSSSPVGETVTGGPGGGGSSGEQVYGTSGTDPEVNTRSSVGVTSVGRTEDTMSTTQSTPTTTPSGLPALCGRRITQHAAASFLVSGTASAYQGRWSWMVAILRADNRTKCGAALVSDRYLVTAAHCIDGSNTTWLSYRVMLGANNRDVSEPGVVYRSIRRIILHDNFTYTKNPFRVEQDLGLVELDSPVTFSAYIQPLCIPEGTTTVLPFPGLLSNFTSCYIIGFGYMQVDATGTRTSSGGVLQEQTVRLTPISSCGRIYYRGYRWLPYSDNLCTHPTNYAKLCSGDSGSPLMCRQGSQWTLLGVASWTFAACIGSSYPSVYVDARLHADWIRQQITNSQSTTVL